MSQTGGCSCGCGGHGKRSEQDERATAPAVAQPLGEGYRSQPVQTSPEDVDAVAVATAVTTALGAAAPQGVAPGHKAGNLLGLRDVSASASNGGGCGCGGH
ncbi:hypothetical protein [Actinomyces sp. Marseille-P3109]|uniref:hypothetical protein n=1 Tax=Actinomyces sp. Marseille-P3109 TaxID=2083009 RepID=UPI000D55D99E|nr:hypothetical protein [Actinomyces sp. Marseille-P3109]